MGLTRHELQVSVVEAARQRIRNAFANGLPVYLSMSGGKDSIVLAHLTYDLIKSGQVDPSLLIVDFIDEEAVFDGVERIVLDWRRRFMEVGVTFRWWCLEVKHFNCFNQLTSDESFICWDTNARGRWVRPMKPFAITEHPMLRRRVDTYQDFLIRVCLDGVTMVGVRLAESVQRLLAFNANYTNVGQRFKPIYDWKDPDIWRYIRDYDLDFPETYMDLYSLGLSRRDMRLSQFFSIDTAKVLVRLSEQDPSLMERVVRREPNAYLAALYWDTELFRTVSAEEIANADGTMSTQDFKASVLDWINTPENYTSKTRLKNGKELRDLIVKFGPAFRDRDWKKAWGILVGGDPKGRTTRALATELQSQLRGGTLMKEEDYDTARS